jgi:hypothetical protein
MEDEKIISTESETSAEAAEPQTETKDITETTVEDKSFKNDSQNKAFAELRRRAEQAEKKASAADKWVEETYGTTHNLHSWDDYQNALAQQKADEQRRQLQDAGIDPSVINQYIDNHPAVKAAKNMTEKAQQEQLQRQLQGEVEELSKEFPESGIKTIDDYINQPNYPDMLKLIQRGYTLSDAYEKVNRAELRKKAAETAKQATLNNVNSKGHLKSPDGSNNIDIASVPADTLKLYKAWFPKMSDADIVKHYKSSL